MSQGGRSRAEHPRSGGGEVSAGATVLSVVGMNDLFILCGFDHHKFIINNNALINSIPMATEPYTIEYIRCS